MSKVWFTDKLLPANGATFDADWRLGADDNISDHLDTETDAIAADVDGELWVHRQSQWRPVSALGVALTAKLSSVGQSLTPSAVGYPIHTDIAEVNSLSTIQNQSQVRAANGIDLVDTGVWLIWLYVYWANPTVTAPELTITVSGTKIAHQTFDRATNNAWVSGIYIASTANRIVSFDYGSTDLPDTVRTAAVKLSDYEA